jgi:hypothetical protein
MDQVLLAVLRRIHDLAVKTMDFHDELAPLYHLIYPDWERSMALQAEQLHHVLQRLPQAAGRGLRHWPQA